MELGLTPQERRERDLARRERNVFIALTVVAILSSTLLYWLDAPL